MHGRELTFIQRLNGETAVSGTVRPRPCMPAPCTDQAIYERSFFQARSPKDRY